MKQKLKMIKQMQQEISECRFALVQMEETGNADKRQTDFRIDVRD